MLIHQSLTGDASQQFMRSPCVVYLTMVIPEVKLFGWDDSANTIGKLLAAVGRIHANWRALQDGSA